MAVMILPTQIGFAAYPEMNKSYEISRDPQNLLILCRKLTKILALGTLCLVAFFELMLSTLVPIALPQYDKSIAICQILLFVCIFRGVSIIYAWLLTTLGLQIKVLSIQFAILILNIILINNRIRKSFYN